MNSDRIRTLRDAARISDVLLPPSPGRRALYDRVFSIPVDGTTLGDLKSEMRGNDPDLNVVYAEDFSNLIAAAYLLDAAGYRGFSIARRGRSNPPDLALTLSDGREVFLEVTRGLDPHEQRESGIREQVNFALRRAMRDDRTLQSALLNWFVQIYFTDHPRTLRDRDRAIAEIIRYIVSTNLKSLAREEFISFESAEYPLLTSLKAEIYISALPETGHVDVQQGFRGAVDSYAPFRRVVELVEKKARRPYTVRPLWLAVSLADREPLLPRELLDPAKIPAFDIMETPFEQILVGSVFGAQVYRR